MAASPARRRRPRVPRPGARRRRAAAVAVRSTSVEVGAAQQQGAAQDPREHDVDRVTGLLRDRDDLVAEARQPVAEASPRVEDREREQRATALPRRRDGHLEMRSSQPAPSTK